MEEAQWDHHSITAPVLPWIYLSSQSDTIAFESSGSCPRWEYTSHSFNDVLRFSDLLLAIVLLVHCHILFPFSECNRAEVLHEMGKGTKQSFSLQIIKISMSPLQVEEEFKPVLSPCMLLPWLFTCPKRMLLMVMTNEKKALLRRKEVTPWNTDWASGYLQRILFCWDKAKWSCAWFLLIRLWMDCSKWTILCHYEML